MPDKEDEKRVRVLLLEDSEIDAELLAARIGQSALPVEIEHVVDRAAFEASLRRRAPDIVLADYSLPDFDGLSALNLAREILPETPFIFVSGVVGEEFATNAIRRGANDYVLKRNLTRLPTAIERALAEAREKTDRRRAEAALATSETRMRLAIEAGALGLWDFDPRTGDLAWDATCRKLFGVGATARVDYPRFLASVHPDDRTAIAAAVKKAITFSADPQPIDETFRIVLPDGRLRWILTRGLAIFEQGECVRFAGVVRDVTEERRGERVLRDMNATLAAEVGERTRELEIEVAERQRIEATLAQLQRLEAVGQLTAGIAHDFNNLLTVVLGNLGFVERDIVKAGLDGRVLERIAQMRTAAQRGAKLTAQMLAFSRRQKLEPRSVDLNDMIGGLRDMLQTTLGGNIGLETVPHEGLWPALVDPTQIEMILLNLAINARDAMEDGGVLTVQAANIGRQDAGPRPAGLAAGDYVKLTVRDTGTGMSEDVLAKVFEPFFTTKEIGKGSGLGLAQVYGFARQSGGGVRIETALGAGTVVEVFLPRAPWVASVDRGEAAAPKAQAPPQTRSRVLVVDDDGAVREVTAALLNDMGFDVIEAASGSIALDLLRDGSRVDLMMVDYAMPGMNGVETAAAARRLRPTLPVLFATGYADLAALKHVGEDNLIQKPFGPDELPRKLSAVLRAAVPAGATILPLSRRQ